MGDNFFIQRQTPAQSFVGFCLCKLKRINNWKYLWMVLWFYEIVSVSCFYTFQQGGGNVLWSIDRNGPIPTIVDNRIQTDE